MSHEMLDYEKQQDSPTCPITVPPGHGLEGFGLLCFAGGVEFSDSQRSISPVDIPDQSRLRGVALFKPIRPSFASDFLTSFVKLVELLAGHGLNCSATLRLLQLPLSPSDRSALR